MWRPPARPACRSTSRATRDLADGAYLDVASADTWGNFLDAYYSAGDAIPDAEQPQFTDPDAGPDVSFDDDGASP